MAWMVASVVSVMVELVQIWVRMLLATARVQE